MFPFKMNTNFVFEIKKPNEFKEKRGGANGLTNRKSELRGSCKAWKK